MWRLRRILPYIAVALAFYVFCRSFYYLGEQYAVYPGANFIAFLDRVFGSIMIVPPMVSWFIIGFILGATVYFVVYGSHRTMRLRRRRPLILAAVAALIVLLAVAGPHMEFAAAGHQYLRPHLREPYPGQVMTFQNIEFVWVPPGRFRMGTVSQPRDPESDEQPHIVTISRGFWLSRFEITQGQWLNVQEDNRMFHNSREPDGGLATDLPADSLTWDNAQEFIRRLNSFTLARPFRLPTEAEWEYACRAGSMSAYSFGDDSAALQEHAWYVQNSSESTHRVGQKTPNAWGLYDMHGNVWEWCRDYYGEYPGGRAIDPVNNVPGVRNARRTLRGGSYQSAPGDCRSAKRFLFIDGYFQEPIDVGFRVLREFQPSDIRQEEEENR